MQTETAPTCGECGTAYREGELNCRLCGHLLAREEKPPPLPPAPPHSAATYPLAAPARAALPASAMVGSEPRILGLREPWFYLLAGLVAAPVFLLTPLLSLIGWYFGALVHEIGHCVAGWLVGRPAYPVLGMNGHAMSCGEQFTLVVALGVYASGLACSWFFLEGRRRWIVGGAVLLLYPVLVFTGLGELTTVVGGHLGEMVFAGIFLYRALTGGFTESPAERGLYAVMGWYLVGDNLRLTGGLMFSEAARRTYEGNGSYGLVNDYLVAANQIFGTSVETVAAVMTLPALAVVPVAIGMSFLLGRERIDS